MSFLSHRPKRVRPSIIEPLENRQLLSTTYYVSPSGSDSSNGTSTSSAWKSVAKVNNVKFSAGDKVLFQGGSTFSGTLTFGVDDKGTTSAPVTVGSYGTGRATISSDAGRGLYIVDKGDFNISNINFVGAGRTSNTTAGIDVYNALSGNVKLDHIYIDHVDVSGYGDWGIAIGGWNGTSAFKDVNVTYSDLHDNARGGLHTYAMGGKSNQNVYIGHVSAYNNPGNPADTHHTGDGIILAYVDGGTIDRCVAHDNGAQNTYATGGPVGIWAFESNNITIQHCESYSNHTASRTDGGGFDFDGGVTNSVMQYNYSHDNDGAGYLLCTFPNSSGWSNNTFRYNVSQNDGRKNGYGGIVVGTGSLNAQIYNNTIFMSPTATGGGGPALGLYYGSNISVRNNLFIATNGMRLVTGSGGSARVFQDNAYWSSGSTFKVIWGGTNYSTLAAWQSASGMEMLNGAATGYSGDPKLIGAGTAATINNGDSLQAALTAYKLQSSSPLINKALNLKTLFNVNPGTQDFDGDTIMQGPQYDIGADEFTGTVIVNAPPTAAPALSTVTTSGGSTYDFTVTYSDDGAIKASTIDSHDVLVTGPNGYSQLASLVSVNLSGDGTPRVATYTVPAAGGTWDSTDNGTYTATMQASQVSDTSGLFVAGGALGTFTVNVSTSTPPPTFATITDGALTVQGTLNDDTISVTANLAANTLTATLNGASMTFNKSAVTSIIIRGSNGNDTETVGPGVGNCTMYGGVGSDSLYGGSGADVLIGGNGNDYLAGGMGNDTYTFNVASAQSDTVSELSGGGTDTLDFSSLASNDPITVNLSSDTALASHQNRTVVALAGQAANIENVLGGAGNDNIVGNNAPNFITGGEGSDYMEGRGNNDVYVFNTASTDQVDTINEISGGGSDTLSFTGLLAGDNLTVDLSSDSALASHLHRIVRTFAAGQAAFIENANGGAGNDVFYGNSAVNKFYGKDGNDTFHVADLIADIVDGGNGTDTVEGTVLDVLTSVEVLI